MNKRWLIALGSTLALVLLLGVGLAACSAPKATPISNSTGGSNAATGGNSASPLVSGAGVVMTSGAQLGIWVSGEGKVSAVPDTAVLTLGVEAKANAVSDAQSQAQSAMNGIVTALHQFNVADKDIQTQNFSITAVYKYPPNAGPVPDGYSVTNTVVVKIRNIANTGAIIDAVAKVGGDLTRIQGVSFTVDNPKPLLDQARAAAVQDAMAKAQQIASVAGVTLGKPVSITESGGYQPPRPIVMSSVAGAAPAATTPISPGSTDITVTVQMGFNIQ